MSRAAQPISVTVLLCVFRPQHAYFVPAVQSILDQTFADFELLIIEDPSDSSGRAMLADMEDDRIRYYSNTHRSSLVDQKNQGLALARGEFVAMFDADDLAEPDRLSKQVAFLRSHPEIGVVGSQIGLIDPQGRCIGYRCFPTDHLSVLRAMPRIVPLCQPSIMARRDVLMQGGGYQYKSYPAAEDYELWSRLIQQGVQFANHPEALLQYRLHPQQMKYLHLKDTIRAVLDIKGRYWYRHMSWQGKLRMLAEKSLLSLPARLVYQLLLRTQYRDPPPQVQPSPLYRVPQLATESAGASSC
jgi:glycosyltransferase involved in cell wall biosynthesis